MKRIFLALWIVLLMAGSGWPAQQVWFGSCTGNGANYISTSSSTAYGFINGNAPLDATETNRSLMVPDGATLSYFSVTMSALPTSGTVTYTIMYDGSPSTATVQFTTSSATFLQDTTHTVTVAAPSGSVCKEVSVKCEVDGTVPANTVATWTTCVDTSTTRYVCMMGSSGSNSTAEGTTYLSIGSPGTAPASAFYQGSWVNPSFGSYNCSKMYVKCAAPGVGKNVVVTVHGGARGADADKTITCTITGAATTGSDTTHTYSSSASFLDSFKIVTDAGSGLGPIKISMIITAETDATSYGDFYYVFSDSGTATLDGTNPSYMSLFGGYNALSTSADVANYNFGTYTMIDRLSVSVETAAGAGKSWTFTAQRGVTPANSAVTKQITTGTEGAFTSFGDGSTLHYPKPLRRELWVMKVTPASSPTATTCKVSYRMRWYRNIGATFYIKAAGNNGSSGVDDGNAWADMKNVYQIPNVPGDYYKFKCGDTISSVPGGNSRPFYFRAGTPTNPVTVTSYDTGARPILASFGNAITTWTDAGGGIYTKVTSEPSNLFEMPVGTYSAVALPRVSGVAPAAGQYSYSGGTIYYHPTSGVETDWDKRIRGSGIGIDVTASDPTLTTGGIIFDNLHILGGALGTSGLLNLSTETSNITLQNCIIDQGQGYLKATGVKVSNVLLNNNTFNNCSDNAQYFASSGPVTAGYWDGVTISNNVFNNTNFTQSGLAWRDDIAQGSIGVDHDALAIQNMRNSIVENNQFINGCRNAAITFWWAASSTANNNIIRNNYFYNLSACAINYSGGSPVSAGADIYNNIINTFCTLGTSGAYTYASGIFTEGNTSTTIYVYNNTIYNGDVGLYNSATNGYNVTYKNNIISTMSQYLCYMADGTLHSRVFDYNDYVSGDSGTPFSFGGVAKTWAQWKTWTGADTNSITTDPLFLNAGGSFALATDFKIRFDSPCKSGTGTDVGLTSDYFSLPYVGSRYPIGASSGSVTVNLTTYAKNKILNHLLKVASYSPNTTMFMGLFTADPTSSGSLTNEANYSGYDRQEITFSAATLRTISQSPNTVTFPRATAGSSVVTYWAIIDAPYPGGNMLAYGPIDTTVTVSPSTAPIQVSSGVTVAFTSGGISNNYANFALDWLFNGGAMSQPVHLDVALTSTAGTDAAIGTELSGSGYARVREDSWSTSTVGSSYNSDNVTFGRATGTWSGVVGTAILDDVGSYIFYGATNKTITAKNGDYIRFPAGSLTVTMP